MTRNVREYRLLYDGIDTRGCSSVSEFDFCSEFDDFYLQDVNISEDKMSFIKEIKDIKSRKRENAKRREMERKEKERQQVCDDKSGFYLFKKEMMEVEEKTSVKPERDIDIFLKYIYNRRYELMDILEHNNMSDIYQFNDKMVNVTKNMFRFKSFKEIRTILFLTLVSRKYQDTNNMKILYSKLVDSCNDFNELRKEYCKEEHHRNFNMIKARYLIGNEINYYKRILQSLLNGYDLDSLLSNDIVNEAISKFRNMLLDEALYFDLYQASHAYVMHDIFENIMVSDRFKR